MSNIRRRKLHGDHALDGEGTLVTSFGDRQSLKIGRVRIHLDMIKATGLDDGMREIRVICIGPKEVSITRIPR